MSTNIISELHAVHVGASTFIASFADFTTGNPSTDVVNLSGHGGALFLVIKGAGAVGNATITVGSCDDVTPSTATAIAFKYKKVTSGDTETAWTDATSAGVATGANANVMFLVWVGADTLYSTNKYARLTLTESDSTACDGAVACLLLSPRYAKSIPATALT